MVRICMLKKWWGPVFMFWCLLLFKTNEEKIRKNNFKLYQYELMYTMQEKCHAFNYFFALYCLFRLFFSDLEPLPAERHPSQQKDPEHRLKELGATDSSTTAPRSAGGSISEDVFTETELSPIREEEQASNKDLQQDKSSDASTESVQTLTQVEVTSLHAPGSAHSSVSQLEEPAAEKTEDNATDTATVNDSQSFPTGSEHPSGENPPSTPTNATSTSSTSQAQEPNSSSCTSRPGSLSSATTSVSAAPQEDANLETDVSKTDTMQQDIEEKGSTEETQKDELQNSAEGKHTYWVIMEVCFTLCRYMRF